MSKWGIPVSKSDVSEGESRLNKNLVISWACQCVLILNGFFMPRLIDIGLGQTMLGLWDFGWTFVAYISLLGLGTGAGVNRFVANAKAKGRETLQGVVAQLIWIQLGVTGLFISVLACVFWQFDRVFAFIDPELQHEAWRVLLTLAIAAVLMDFGSLFRGMLTGFHRWDAHNLIHVFTSCAHLILTFWYLQQPNASLYGVAVLFLLVCVLSEILRVCAIYVFCQGVSFRPKKLDLSQAKTIITFSLKSFLSTLTPLLLLQGINWLIFMKLGPVALAVFARASALTRHVQTFLHRFTMMITPIVSGYQASEQNEEVKRVFYQSTTRAYLIAGFALLNLALVGDWLMLLWMGEKYVLPGLITLLALGHILPIAHDVSLRLLMGQDQHGRFSLMSLGLFAALSIMALIVSEQFGVNLMALAALLVVVKVLIYGVYLPLYACKRLRVSSSHFHLHCLIKPSLTLLPLYLAVLTMMIFNLNTLMLGLLVVFANVITLVTLSQFYFSISLSQGRLKLIRKEGTYAAYAP